MKRLLFGFLLMAISGAVWAKNYCGESMTMGDKTISLSCELVSTGNYRITIVSTEQMVGLGGSFCNVNGVGGYQLNAGGHYTLSADGLTITCDIASNSAPNLYTPLYVIFANGGERNCNWPNDVAWDSACDGSVTPDPDPITPGTPIVQHTDSTKLTPDLHVNLALNQPFVAGDGNTTRTNTNDGNIGNGANIGQNQPESTHWWMVDLGEVYDVREIHIYWEGAYSTDFVIQSAETLPTDLTDDSQWATAYATGSGYVPNIGTTADKVNVYNVIVGARYLRIKSNACYNEGWAINIHEFEVYGLPVRWCTGHRPTFTGTTQNIALDKCSYAAQAQYNAAYGNDGNTGNFFKTNQPGANHPADEWWYVNLDSTYNLSEIRISWDVSYAKHFLIQVAIDEPTSESDWRTIKTVSGTPTYLNSGAGNNYDTYDVVDNYAHYVRIKADSCNTAGCSDGIAFFECQIFANRFATEEDLAAPVLTSAILSSLNTTTATLTMIASQDGQSLHRYHIVDAHNGIDTIVYTNLSDQMNLLLPQDRHYNLTVTAVGFDGQESNAIVVEVEMPYDLVYNIALDKPAYSGYEAWENERFNAGRANDGYLNTRWGTNDNRAGDFACDFCDAISHPDGDWWMVDLGEEYRLTEIQIFWELAYSYDYIVEVSLDSINWTTISHEVFSGIGTDVPLHTQHSTPAAETEATIFRLDDEPARYVRIANQGATTCYNDCLYGISIWEVRVYGSNYHVPTQCVWNGGPGSGSKGNGAAKPFANGYTLSVGMNETGDSILVDFISYDNNIGLTGVCNGVFQEFVVEDVRQNTNEYRYLNQDNSNPFHFYGAVPYTHKNNKWYNTVPMEEWQDGQTVRIAVKYEYAGGFSISDPVYYELGVGCAPDTFFIYHYDDKEKETDRIEYEGGKILQPIVYRRKFKPGIWETLYLPFDVNKVTVVDPDDGVEYELYPQQNSENADYWLRTFSVKGENVAVTQPYFKPNWKNVKYTLPRKDIPYIMMVPSDGDDDNSDDWYADKYINFYGIGYQTINGTFTLGEAPGKNAQDSATYLYFGNQTMKTQYIGDAYVISEDGLWFENSTWTGNTTNTLYPFECYVLSDPITMQTIRQLPLNAKQAPQTATSLPQTGEAGIAYFYDGTMLNIIAEVATPLAIYSADGRLVASFMMGEGESRQLALQRGIYIVSTAASVAKIAL